MRLLILASSTVVGGAERMSITLANHLSKRVSTLLVVGRGGELSSEIDPSTESVDLNVTRMRQSVGPLRRLLRQWRPSIAFAPQPDASVPLAVAWRLAGRPGSLVLRESNYRSGSARLPYFHAVARMLGWAYRQADVVVAPSEAVATDLATRYRLPVQRISTLYNPVDIERLRQRGASTGEAAHEQPRGGIIAVGRLVPQKGFDLLLRAFAAARALATRTDIRLTILGEGPERARLERLAEELRLTHVVRLPGVSRSPFAEMSRATAFVLSSRWEGFPNSLVEAMALGVPPIAFRCPGGASEIIEDGRSGLLCDCESVNGLADAMVRLVGDLELRRTLAAGAAARARAFDAPQITTRYLELFQTACAT